jgi:hypothetical protein
LDPENDVVTTKAETRLGVTPVLQRLAYYYLCRGLGEHPIRDWPYDKVVVREMYPWQPNPNNPLEYQGGIVVEFHKNGKRERYVEFGVRRVGAGGHDAIKIVPPQQ